MVSNLIYKLETHRGVTVLRDDLLTGGTKSRFIGGLLEAGRDYYVYASPVYGGFQIALAAAATALGKKAIIFCAKRKTLHSNTLRAKAAGGGIAQVKCGYLSVVTAKAKEFTAANNAQLLTFGANEESVINGVAGLCRIIWAAVGEPEEIFLAYGSGTLTKGVLRGTDTAKVKAVQVGKDPDFTHERLTVLKYGKPFDKAATIKQDFPSCENYDLKAWEYCLKYKGGGKVFFWNVLG